MCNKMEVKLSCIKCGFSILGHVLNIWAKVFTVLLNFYDLSFHRPRESGSFSRLDLSKRNTNSRRRLKSFIMTELYMRELQELYEER